MKVKKVKKKPARLFSAFKNELLHKSTKAVYDKDSYNTFLFWLIFLVVRLLMFRKDLIVGIKFIMNLAGLVFNNQFMKNSRNVLKECKHTTVNLCF